MRSRLPFTRGALFAAAVLLSSCAGGTTERAPAATATTGAIERELRRDLELRVRRMGDWGLSGAVLVATRAGVVLQAAVGTRGPGSDEPITAETVFDIGSLSKQFTATAVLRLADQGRLAVTDSIGGLLTGVPADRAGITLHQLLTHTSGLPREVGRDFESMSREEFVRRVLAAPLESRAGTRYSYSNAGYALLAAVVEIVSGRPFHDFMRDEVLSPAGVERTGFYSRPPRGVPIARAGNGVLAGQSPADWEHAWNHRGSGGMVSTVGDLLQFTNALEAGLLVGPASLEAQRTPYTSGYGYGIQVDSTESGRLRLRHVGLWYAFTSDYRRYPHDSVTIVVLTNRALDGMHVASVAAAALEASVFGRPRPLPPPVTAVDPKRRDRMVGSWRLSSGGQIEIAARGDDLVVLGRGQDAVAALTFPDPAPDSAAVSRVNAATLEILGGVGRGDFSTLKAMASSERADRYERVLPGIWREREDSLGRVSRIDLIGTIAPAGVDRVWETHALIRYERGEERVALYWTPAGRLAGLANENPELPAALTTFRPSGSGMVAHHLNTGTTVRLELSDGRLLIRRADGTTVVAQRAR